jgi:RNase P subunit RPR2
MSLTICDATVNLSTPVRSERVRVPFQKSRTVWIYRCPACGHERRVFASSFRGQTPTPSVGAIRCGSYTMGEAR